MIEKYDLIVIGAGPAGLMASIVGAEEGLRVLLVEQKKDVSKVTRTCTAQWITEPMTHGECISVEKDRVVFRLNDFSIEYSADRIPVKQYIRVSPGGNKLVFENKYDPTSISFDKGVLLRGLLRKAESLGVKVATETRCIDALDEEDGVSVRLSDRDGERVEQGRYLILADGVNSPLGTRLGFDKERTFFGEMQALSYFFENVECPYPRAYMVFVGSGHIKGGMGTVYMVLRPGTIEGKKNVFEVAIAGPADDPVPLTDKIRYFTEEGHFAEWFKHSKRIYTNSAALKFHTPLATPAKGRTLVAGDAAAFIQTLCQGALIYGRSAAKAVVGKIREGKDFTEYITHWQNTYGYNKPNEIEKVTKAYGITTFGDEELDYIFSFTDDKTYNGYAAEFNDYERIRKILYQHMDTIKKEKPELAGRLESYLNFQVSSVKEGLQLVNKKDNK